jgi:hypothetical protein
MLWKILHEGVHYDERGPAVSAKSQRTRTARMIKELQKLGYHVNMATLLFAPQPLAYARGSVRRRFEPRTSESGCAITYDVLFRRRTYSSGHPGMSGRGFFDPATLAQDTEGATLVLRKRKSLREDALSPLRQ